MLKVIVFFASIAIPLVEHAQTNESTRMLQPFGDADTTQGVMELKELPDSAALSYWQTGEYKIYIETAGVVRYLDEGYKSLLVAMDRDYTYDSIGHQRCEVYAQRYLKAYNTITAQVNNFDLRQLAVYIGPDNAERDQGSSTEIEWLVRHAVEQGLAEMYYKGERIKHLQFRTISDLMMSVISVYYDDPSVCAFIYYDYINW
jgi:hypothetical protein